MAYPLRDVGINCHKRDRICGGGFGQQSPSTLWEPVVVWPNCKNSSEFSTCLRTPKRDAHPSQEKPDSLGHLQAKLLSNDDVCWRDRGPELENPSMFWDLQVSDGIGEYLSLHLLGCSSEFIVSFECLTTKKWKGQSFHQESMIVVESVVESSFFILSQRPKDSTFGGIMLWSGHLVASN